MNQSIFPGAELFDLKTEQGFPMEIAIDIIINDNKMAISWVDFIESARINGWNDSQSYKTIMHALDDAEIPKEIKLGIKKRLQLYLNE